MLTVLAALLPFDNGRKTHLYPLPAKDTDMGRRLTTSLHDNDDACKAIPDDMSEFCSDLDEHIPVICQLMARKAQAKTQTDPARKLPKPDPPV